MLVLEDFLTSDECDGLVALASGGERRVRGHRKAPRGDREARLTLPASSCRLAADLRRSRVTDGHVSSGRTSFSTFLTGVKVLCDALRVRCISSALNATSRAQASHPLVTLIESRMTRVVSEAQAMLDVIDCTPDEARGLSFVAAEPLQVVRYTVSQGTHAVARGAKAGGCLQAFRQWRRPPCTPRFAADGVLMLVLKC